MNTLSLLPQVIVQLFIALASIDTHHLGIPSGGFRMLYMVERAFTWLGRYRLLITETLENDVDVRIE